MLNSRIPALGPAKTGPSKHGQCSRLRDALVFARGLARTPTTVIALALCIWIMPATPEAAADDWLQWRGPLGTGISQETGVPQKWSQTENIRWKVKLDGEGNSSPIVVDSKVFITHAPTGSAQRELRCYDRSDGSLLWTKGAEYAEKEITHQTNPLCASSPVSDGERIVAWFGSAGLYCFDLNGEQRWKVETGKVDHIWGYGSSPIIYQNLVLLNFGPGVNSYVAAFSLKDGAEVWRRTFAEQVSSKHEEYRGSWSTPVIMPQGNSETLLLSMPDRLWAVSPLTGEDRWSCGGLSKLLYTSPLIAGDLVVSMAGYNGPAIAVRAEGTGDLTDTRRVWLHEKGNPQRVGSGVVVGEHLYILNEPGIAWCIHVPTGEITWKERLDGASSWSSMTAVDGHLQVTTMKGSTILLQADPTACQVIGINELGEMTRATPAYSNGQIFIRTYQHLYCIEESQ